MSTFTMILLLLINKERATPVEYDKILASRAQERAEYLCEHNQWSHEGFASSFDGYGGKVGENLAKGYKRPKEIHKALMASPTHKQVIQRDSFQYVGIGSSCGITVELFASVKK